MLLPELDYDLIRNNPKILMGFSDIISLLLAVHTKTGMITFHGPMGAFEWPEITVDYMNRVLFDGELVKFANKKEDPVHTINGGTARGKLFGGNLAVFQSMLATEYLPDFDGAILFLEDVSEPSYKIEKMLVQLKQAGILDKISGFIFGTCNRCAENNGLTFEYVYNKHIEPLNIPSWRGAMFGHQQEMFTLPIGAMVEIDADRGTITMLHPAVK